MLKSSASASRNASRYAADLRRARPPRDGTPQRASRTRLHVAAGPARASACGERERLAVVAADQVHHDRLGPIALESPRAAARCCRPTWPSSRRSSGSCRCASTAARARHRAPRASARPRSRGAGRRGPSRRRGCRSRRPSRLLGHRRALDVPARTPRSPRRVPRGVLARLGAPSTARSPADPPCAQSPPALALVHVVQLPVREAAVVGSERTRKYTSPPDRVGVPERDERLDVVDDRLHRLRGQRLVVGAPQAEGARVGAVQLGHLARRARRSGAPCARAAS